MNGKYRILLVDDEELVLKSLRMAVEWEDYGFQVAGWALTAREAMEQIELLKPDVVFTDIRMPDTDGLELIRRIRVKAPHIKCMVISGYAEFAYAQKAMSLSAVGYCLKPFDPDEIGLYLKKMKRMLDREREEQTQGRMLAEYLENGREGTEGLLQDFLEQSGRAPEGEFEAVYLLGGRVPEQAALAWVPVGYGKSVCLVDCRKEEEFLSILGIQKKSANLHVGIGRRAWDLQNLGKDIRHAKRAAYQHFCQPEIGWVVREVGAKNLPSTPELQMDIYHGKTEGVRRYLAAVEEEFAAGNYNIDTAVLLRNLLETWRDGGNPENTPAFSWDYDDLCREFQDVGQMLAHMGRELCQEEEKGTGNLTFQEIYDYVEKHYRETLSVSLLAEKFHVSACYLSHLFKKELGKTFTEYLRERKIGYACRLLEGSGSITEIAERAGFQDYFYFSRVFRKVMDCTPSEYRERSTRG